MSGQLQSVLKGEFGQSSRTITLALALKQEVHQYPISQVTTREITCYASGVTCYAAVRAGSIFAFSESVGVGDEYLSVPASL